MDPNPYSDKLEDDEASPFAGEKTASTGIGGQRGNDPNANAMEQHRNDANRHPNDSPPLMPEPDLLHDGT